MGGQRTRALTQLQYPMNPTLHNLSWEGAVAPRLNGSDPQAWVPGKPLTWAPELRRPREPACVEMAWPDSSKLLPPGKRQFTCPRLGSQAVGKTEQHGDPWERHQEGREGIESGAKKQQDMVEDAGAFPQALCTLQLQCSCALRGPRLTGSPGIVGGTSCPSFRVALSMRMCSRQRGEAFKSEDLIFTRTEKTVPPNLS